MLSFPNNIQGDFESCADILTSGTCYVPETGRQPVTGYKSGMFRGITNKSWLRLGLQCEPRETPTEAEKLVRTARSTGNDTQSSN
jgi:hypothetical protein